MSDRDMALVSGAAETLEEAHEIAGRLTQAGFARNSVRIERQGDDMFEVSLHVRAANRARAERAIANRSGGFSGNGAVLSLGIGAAALGAGILAVIAARRMAPVYLSKDAAPPADRED